ncbi:glycine cleavage system aminomethyltransferase GcvT [Thermoanaerobacterium sp. DL9XJH110]|uniref:glycine cleavage system aminomethyltransferase GcvT n=1 Tax=Thermoanaerobacterium sp. DL9XJH110 TaxID=3386643 RepID=UPI003BB54D30
MLKRTPLYDEHVKLKAKMTEFGGYEMPIQYTSIIEEHMAVRTKAGVFDVSHMGEILVEGGGAAEFLNGLLTNDICLLKDGGVQYTVMTYDNGGTVDDLLVYRLQNDRYLLVVNASNKDKDFEHIKKYARGDVSVRDVSDSYGQIALQGPGSPAYIEKLLPAPDIRPFSFTTLKYQGKPLMVSRTGYTGEDGFEVYGPPDVIKELFEKFVESGVVPCGLGARDTLRFEAGLPLYGHELAEDITPVEAGLERFIKFHKHFPGRDALYRQVNENTGRRLVGLKLLEKGVPRQGYKVYFGDEEAGYVTSGNYGPYVREYLALALVDVQKIPGWNASGKYADIPLLEIEIRGKRHRAQVTPKNFLKL